MGLMNYERITQKIQELVLDLKASGAGQGDIIDALSLIVFAECIAMGPPALEPLQSFLHGVEKNTDLFTAELENEGIGPTGGRRAVH